MKVAHSKSRWIKILELVNQAGKISFDELLKQLLVSEATLRRDLSELEEQKLLVRFRGGARKIRNTVESSMQMKQTLNVLEKERIGKYAAGLIEPNELVFIGSGTTTLALAHALNDTSMTVITNGIVHAEILHNKKINTFLLCGFIRQHTRSLSGKEMLQLLASYHFDRAFVGANGINVELDILSADENEHQIKQLIARQSKAMFVLADNSKFGKTAMYLVPKALSQNISIITDSGVIGYENQPRLITLPNE
ncbi:DeoR/GlpR transcriptional regulator [Salmonella enterica]|nr:DeoR/GlpR transcriptional regulator [Salmonella enterica]